MHFLGEVWALINQKERIFINQLDKSVDDSTMTSNLDLESLFKDIVDSLIEGVGMCLSQTWPKVHCR